MPTAIVQQKTAQLGGFFMFIAFECFARRVVIIDDKKYEKFTFVDFWAAISTSSGATKHSKGFI